MNSDQDPTFNAGDRVHPTQKRAPEEIATLIGDIAIVDGKNVSDFGNS
jgi:hypothetical protein